MGNYNVDSSFNNSCAFNRVRFGSEFPVLEAELNEMQQIQNSQLRSALKTILGNGISSLDAISYNGTSLSIGNSTLVIEGYQLNCTGLAIALANNETAYLQVWEEETTYSDIIRPFGNQQSVGTITNYIKDPRMNIETSRRMCVKYTLSKAIDGSKLINFPIGTVTNGELVLSIGKYTAPGAAIEGFSYAFIDILASNWSLANSLYTNTITIEDVTVDDVLTISLAQLTLEPTEDQLNAYVSIDDIETFDGGIKLTSNTPITTDIRILAVGSSGAGSISSGGGGGGTGFSPTVDISKSGNTTTIVITDESGPHTATIIDGINGTNGLNGKGITSISKINTVGLVDTYRITYSDDSTSNFTINNGEQGAPGYTPQKNVDYYDGIGITSITKIGTVGTVDTYRITLTNNNTFDFTVNNGYPMVGEIIPDATTINKILSPNVIYKAELSTCTSFEFSLASGLWYDEYTLYLKMGESAIPIGIPIIDKWVGGTPTFAANKTYLITIQNGIGVVGSV